ARPAMRPPLACKIDATPAPTVPQPRRPTPTGRFTRAFLLHAGNRKSECNYIVQDYSTGKGTRKGTAVRIHPRSEERRVGKECRSRWRREHERRKHRQER